eukprot:scaffold137014_cov31-Tisochrysis_lutea.AAC.6
MSWAHPFMHNSLGLMPGGAPLVRMRLSHEDGTQLGRGRTGGLAPDYPVRAEPRSASASQVSELSGERWSS